MYYPHFFYSFRESRSTRMDGLGNDSRTITFPFKLVSYLLTHLKFVNNFSQISHLSIWKSSLNLQRRPKSAEYDLLIREEVKYILGIKIIRRQTDTNRDIKDVKYSGILYRCNSSDNRVKPVLKTRALRGLVHYVYERPAHIYSARMHDA